MDLWYVLSILLVGQALSIIEGRPSVNGRESSDGAILEADKFLTSYGYYPSSKVHPAKRPKSILRKRSNTERTKALKLFQEFYNLPQSGKLDKETTQLMQRPRCGNVDIPSNLNTIGTRADLQMEQGEDVSQTRKDNKTSGIEESGVHVNRGRRRRSLVSPRLTRVKRSNVLIDRDGAMYKWPKDEMRWIFDFQHYSKKLPETVQRRVIEKALSLWDPMVPFKFVEETVDPVAFMRFFFHSFAESKLGDFWHFETDWIEENRAKKKLSHGRTDGKSRAKTINSGLAHAMIPHTVNSHKTSLHRDIHFDEDHDWSEQELLSVALHEIGHAVGLDHSKDTNAVMYPYNRNNSEFSLSDLQNVQAIYGSKHGDLAKHICDAKFNTLTDVFKAPFDQYAQSYYFISGDRVQLISEMEQILTYYPFENVFPNVTSKYDVAFASGTNLVIFIAGLERFIVESFGKRGFGHTTAEGYYGLTGSFAVNIDTPAEQRTRLFTEKNVWDVKMNGPTEQFLGSTFRESSSNLKKLIKNAKFVVQWKDGLVYVVTRDGRYATMNVSLEGSGSEEISEMKEGHPPWMRRLLCEGRAAPCDGVICHLSRGHSTKTWGGSGQGLMLVGMLSLIKLY